MHRNRFIFLPVVILLLLQACTKDTNYISTIPASDNPYLLQTDTFSATGIIYRTDSFITAKKSLLFAGLHNDPLFGIVNSTAYFRPGLPASVPELTNNSYFDSLVLVIKPKHIYYGDTTSLYKLNLYRLSEDMINADENVFYNTQSFAVYPNAVGTAAVIYRPNIDDSIVMKLDNILGKELFTIFKNNTTAATDAAVFKDYLKGLRLQPDVADKVMYAMSAADSSLSFRIHYHNDLGKQVAGRIDFSMANDGFAFSAISTTRTGTPLSGLDANTSIAATTMIVDQELTRTRTRITFPHLKEILKQGYYVKILNASLQVKPVTTRYATTYTLPPAVNLYYYNSSGNVEGPLATSSGSTSLSGDLYVDEGFETNTRYTYDVTSYVNAQLTATSYTDKSLVLVTADADNRLEQLVAGMPGNSSYNTKLIVSLLVYNQ